jgi:hypothetical protein
MLVLAIQSQSIRNLIGVTMLTPEDITAIRLNYYSGMDEEISDLQDDEGNIISADEVRKIIFFESDFNVKDVKLCIEALKKFLTDIHNEDKEESAWKKVEDITNVGFLTTIREISCFKLFAKAVTKVWNS